MKIIRKIAAILVALSLSLMLFAGCQQQSAEKIDIGIIQLIENGAFNDMREGFIQQMKEKAMTTVPPTSTIKTPRATPRT
mgnify:CR=1 FL=1